MKEHFLDFERPLAEIIEKIEALQAASNEDPELLGQIEKLRKEEEKLKNKIFSKLSTWQKVQVARHPQSCLLYTSPSPRDKRQSRMPSSA